MWFHVSGGGTSSKSSILSFKAKEGRSGGGDGGRGDESSYMISLNIATV
jgi:hypothetical protein